MLSLPIVMASLVVERGSGAPGLHWLRHLGPAVVVPGLDHRLSTCGTWA